MIPQLSLGEIVSEVSRPVALEPGVLYRSVGVKWYGAGVHVHETREGNLFDADRFRIEQDDLIYNDMWARMGSVAIVPPDLAGSVASSHFPTFRLDKTKVVPSYLAWYFRTPSFWNDCENASRGSTGRNQIKRSTFSAIHVPLPQLDEQRSVVARIEELVAKVEEARSTRAICEQERVILLNKVLGDRRRQLSEEYPLFVIGSLTKITAGGTPSRDVATYWGGDIPWVKTGELKDGTIDAAEEFITEAGVANSSAKIFPPDTILIALYGQGQTRGRTGRLTISAATNQACCALLPCEPLYPQYLQWWLRSLYTELREDAKGGAQPNWNGGMIKGLSIAVPPRSEQIEIADELDAIQAQVDLVEALQAETAAELDAMLPAILDKAFKGEL